MQVSLLVSFALAAGQAESGRWETMAPEFRSVATGERGGTTASGLCVTDSFVHFTDERGHHRIGRATAGILRRVGPEMHSLSCTGGRWVTATRHDPTSRDRASRVEIFRGRAGKPLKSLGEVELPGEARRHVTHAKEMLFVCEGQLFRVPLRRPLRARQVGTHVGQDVSNLVRLSNGWAWLDLSRGAVRFAADGEAEPRLIVRTKTSVPSLEVVAGELFLMDRDKLYEVDVKEATSRLAHTAPENYTAICANQRAVFWTEENHHRIARYTPATASVTYAHWPRGRLWAIDMDCDGSAVFVHTGTHVVEVAVAAFRPGPRGP